MFMSQYFSWSYTLEHRWREILKDQSSDSLVKRSEEVAYVLKPISFPSSSSTENSNVSAPCGDEHEDVWYDAKCQGRQSSEFERHDRRAYLDARNLHLRKKLYNEILVHEAKRLKCKVSDVRPTVPVLPLESNGEASKLAELPNDVFLKIMEKLETVDIFRITLVCKGWKSYIFNNRTELKKAKHAFSTHLTTFFKWDDLSCNSQSIKHSKVLISFQTEGRKSNAFCEFEYERFRWSLLFWYCRISQNYQELIIDCPFWRNNFIAILHYCPRVQHLQLLDNFTFEISNQKPRQITNTSFEELEFLYVDVKGRTEDHELTLEILAKAINLKTLRYSFRTYDLIWLKCHKPIENVFAGLIALEMTCNDLIILQDMLMVDEFKLKFFQFSLNAAFEQTSRSEAIRLEMQSAFHKVLSKMRRLEILIIDIYPGVSSKTIQLLTQMRVKLKFALLSSCITDVQMTEKKSAKYASTMKQVISSASLLNLQSMLLEHDPGLNLSRISVLMNEHEDLERPRWADIAFTLWKIENGNDHTIKRLGLRNPIVQSLLNIEV